MTVRVDVLFILEEIFFFKFMKIKKNQREGMLECTFFCLSIIEKVHTVIYRESLMLCSYSNIFLIVNDHQFFIVNAFFL